MRETCFHELLLSSFENIPSVAKISKNGVNL